MDKNKIKINMVEIPIKRNLSEETRLQSITFGAGNGVYGLHFKDKFYYITDCIDETKIYAVVAKDLYDIWFGY